MGPLKDQIRESAQQAAQELLKPALQQASQQAIQYAAKEGPRMVKEQIPMILDRAGFDSPQDAIKQGVGKVGEAISDSGGISGIAGKMLSKVGRKSKGGAQATGYGKGRRMPVQQELWVSLPVQEVYQGWTEYKRWPEFMHRVNGSDPDISEDSVKLRITEKMWMFTRPFTAEITMQRPNEVIRWKSVSGPSHVGLIAFHDVGDHLTLMSVNIDHAPSGMIERISRGARFDKRAIRADLHRFKGWLEMRSGDELEDIEGWMGTIEDGEVVTTHDEWMEENSNGQEQDGEGEAGAGEEDEDGEGAARGRGRSGQGGEEGEEGGEDDGEEDQAVEDEDDDNTDDEDEEDEQEDEDEEDEDEEPEEEPKPKPRKRARASSRSRTQKSAADKPPAKKKSSTRTRTRSKS